MESLRRGRVGVVSSKMAGAEGHRDAGEGNFDTVDVIHVFEAIEVNGACWVTACLPLRGAVYLGWLPINPLDARVLSSRSFHTGHVDREPVIPGDF